MTCLLLSVTAVLSVAQGGPPKSGWYLEIKGSLTVTTADSSGISWQKDSYESPATIGTSPYAHVQQGTVSGTVSIRSKWYGTSEPTNFPNFKIKSNVAVLGNIVGAARAKNGFQTVDTVGAPAYADDYVLIQPGKVREYEKTLVISATCGVPSYWSSSFIFSCSFDPRSALVKATMLPNEYFVPVESGEQSRASLTETIWGKYFRYSKLFVPNERIAKNPIFVIGASSVDVRTVGLPQGYEIWSTPYPPPYHEASNEALNTFNTSVLQFYQNGENYLFTSYLVGDVAGETLPNPFSGFALDTLGEYHYYGSKITKKASGLDYEETETTNDGAQIVYNWVDGLKADSKLELTFVSKFIDDHIIHTKNLHKGEVHLPFVIGAGGFVTAEYSTYDGAGISGGASKKVRWGNTDAVVRAGSAIVTLAGCFLAVSQPLAGAYVALAGYSASLGAVGQGEGMIAPDPPATADTDLLKHQLD